MVTYKNFKATLNILKNARVKFSATKIYLYE